MHSTHGTIKKNLSVTALLLVLCSVMAQAGIDGIVVSGAVNLAAKPDQISTPDGGSLLIWGYTNGARAQYPGPTLIAGEGQTVTVNLTNNLAVPVSLVFPGQENVAAAPAAGATQQGLLTLEALPGGTVTYSFVATKPGTFMYHSGTNPELQVEMGLVGALIVRPAMGADYAYNHADSKFGPDGHEYLFLLSEMDHRVHQAVEFGLPYAQYLADYWPTYWFINGRAGPDTMSAAGVSWLPTQPYNCFPRMHAADKLLIRLIGAGREQHPFHTHGNHARIIGRNGVLQTSGAGPALDLSREVFTIQSIPGETIDALFDWTGKDLGWDIYGTTAGGRPHLCNGLATPSQTYDPLTKEWCGDHEKPFPVVLPETQFSTVGAFYSGSPFMGALGALPPGEGGLNPNGGFPFMWHSHSEKELTNNNIFPGGMLTMLIIEPTTAPIN